MVAASAARGSAACGGLKAGGDHGDQGAEASPIHTLSHTERPLAWQQGAGMEAATTGPGLELGTSYRLAPGYASRRQKALAACREAGRTSGGRGGGQEGVDDLTTLPSGQLHQEVSLSRPVHIPFQIKFRQSHITDNLIHAGWEVHFR